MPADAGTVEFIQFLGACLIACAAWIWYLNRTVDRGCRDCPHCQARIREEERRKRAEEDETRRFYGLGPREDDRPQPPSPPSRDEDGDEGRRE